MPLALVELSLNYIFSPNDKNQVEAIEQIYKDEFDF